VLREITGSFSMIIFFSSSTPGGAWGGLAIFLASLLLSGSEFPIFNLFSTLDVILSNLLPLLLILGGIFLISQGAQQQQQTQQQWQWGTSFGNAWGGISSSFNSWYQAGNQARAPRGPQQQRQHRSGQPQPRRYKLEEVTACVHKLPVRLYEGPEQQASTDHTSCSICCEDYSEGDAMRVLPCKHQFHIECVDQWFLTSTDYTRPPACPLCNQALPIL